MTPDLEMLEVLRCDLQKSGKRTDSYPKRLHNINWVLSLDLSGLVHPVRMKHISVYETLAGEHVLMAIPGKESKRNGKGLRPFDFFPLLFRADGTQMEDLSFGRAFASFCEFVETSGTDRQFALRLLSATVYRMAFMLDHSLAVKEPAVRLVGHDDDGTLTNGMSQMKHFEPYYSFEPDGRVLPAFRREIPSLHVSVEGLLKYLDVIVWNEDTKYYYGRKQELARKGKLGEEPEWLRETGRINTLLSGLTVLGFGSGIVELSDLVDRFTRQRGVAPVADAEIESMSGGLIGTAKQAEPTLSLD